EGQLCDPRSGACVVNRCLDQSCVTGFVCVDGACVVDGCPMTECPEGYRCTTNPIDGSHSCDMPRVASALQEKVVGAGGGGLGCSVGAARRRDPSGSAFGLALALGWVAVRHRRRR